MIILHIAYLRNDPFTGVCVVAPEHIKHQNELAEVALLNICDTHIEGIANQFVYHGRNWKDDVTPEFKKPDLIVFHEVYHIEFVRIAKTLVRDEIPYVIIPHGCLVNSAQHKKWWKKRLANTFIFNRYIYHCSTLQCLSNNELLNTHFNVHKFIGTNGVNIPDTLKTSFNREKLKIVYIGRLEIVHKGLDLLIKAIKIAENTLLKYNARIDIYGPDILGRFDAVRDLIITTGVENIVTLHKSIEGEDKIKCLLDADFFIQTSRYEGMPMGILEAMSYGVPCLITEGTCLGEITRKYNAGWVAKTTEKSIALTLEKAVTDVENWRNKSCNARKLIIDNFSWNTIASNTLNHYKQICSTRNN